MAKHIKIVTRQGFYICYKDDSSKPATKGGRALAYPEAFTSYELAQYKILINHWEDTMHIVEIN